MVTKIDASMFDAQGKEIILDADADTSITADTDDQIDIKIAGADQFSMFDGSIKPTTTNDVDLGSSFGPFPLRIGVLPLCIFSKCCAAASIVSGVSFFAIVFLLRFIINIMSCQVVFP